MSFAYRGKDFYLVASPKRRFFIKVRLQKSQVVQPELEVSCKTSFIPHAHSPQQQKSSALQKSYCSQFLTSAW